MFWTYTYLFWHSSQPKRWYSSRLKVVIFNASVFWLRCWRISRLSFPRPLYIISRPKNALKPPLICLFIRQQVHMQRLLKIQIYISFVWLKVGGGEGYRANFPIEKRVLYLFKPKACSKTSAYLFAHLTTSMHTVVMGKKNCQKLQLFSLCIHCKACICSNKQMLVLTTCIYIQIYIYIYDEYANKDRW